MGKKLSSVSEMLVAMSQLVNPTPEQDLEESFSKVKDCSSSLRAQNFEIDRCNREFSPVCRICHEDFDHEANTICLKYKNSTSAQN